LHKRQKLLPFHGRQVELAQGIDMNMNTRCSLPVVFLVVESLSDRIREIQLRETICHGGLQSTHFVQFGDILSGKCLGLLTDNLSCTNTHRSNRDHNAHDNDKNKNQQAGAVLWIGSVGHFSFDY